jgi:hypothetical protein
MAMDTTRVDFLGSWSASFYEQKIQDRQLFGPSPGGEGQPSFKNENWCHKISFEVFIATTWSRLDMT